MQPFFISDIKEKVCRASTQWVAVWFGFLRHLQERKHKAIFQLDCSREFDAPYPPPFIIASVNVMVHALRYMEGILEYRYPEPYCISVHCT